MMIVAVLIAMIAVIAAQTGTVSKRRIHDAVDFVAFQVIFAVRIVAYDVAH